MKMQKAMRCATILSKIKRISLAFLAESLTLQNCALKIMSLYIIIISMNYLVKLKFMHRFIFKYDLTYVFK